MRTLFILILFFTGLQQVSFSLAPQALTSRFKQPQALQRQKIGKPKFPRIKGPAATYFIFDLKITPDGRMIILEAGRGQTSGLSIKGNARKKLIDHIASIQKQLPAIYAYQPPIEEKKIGIPLDLTPIKSAKIFNDSSLLVKAINKLAVKDNFNPQDLSTYSAFVFPNGSKELLAQQYPHIFVFGQTNLQAEKIIINDKWLTDATFKQQGLSAFRPRVSLQMGPYQKTLSQRILKDLKHPNMCVIKPLNSSNGRGVIIVEKTRLDQNLSTILPHCVDDISDCLSISRDKPSTLDDWVDLNSKAYTYWQDGSINPFIVEELVDSQNISISELDSRQGTMRAVCLLTHDGNSLTIQTLETYWKMASSGQKDQVDLSQRYVSDVHQEHGILRTSPILHQQVAHILETNVVPRFYAGITNMNIVEHLKAQLGKRFINKTQLMQCLLTAEQCTPEERLQLVQAISKAPIQWSQQNDQEQSYYLSQKAQEIITVALEQADLDELINNHQSLLNQTPNIVYRKIVLSALLSKMRVQTDKNTLTTKQLAFFIKHLQGFSKSIPKTWNIAQLDDLIREANSASKHKHNLPALPSEPTQKQLKERLKTLLNRIVQNLEQSA